MYIEIATNPYDWSVYCRYNQIKQKKKENEWEKKINKPVLYYCWIKLSFFSYKQIQNIFFELFVCWFVASSLAIFSIDLIDSVLFMHACMVHHSHQRYYFSCFKIYLFYFFWRDFLLFVLVGFYIWSVLWVFSFTTKNFFLLFRIELWMFGAVCLLKCVNFSENCYFYGFLNWIFN